MVYSTPFLVEPQVVISPVATVAWGSVFTLTSYLKLSSGSKSPAAKTMDLVVVSAPAGGTLTATATSVSALDGSLNYNHLNVYLDTVGTYTLSVTCSTCAPTVSSTIQVTVFQSPGTIEIDPKVNYLPKGFSGFTYTIVLKSKPEGDVKVAFAVTSGTLISITSPGSPVTFTSTNYATPQTITLSASGVSATPPTTYPHAITHSTLTSVPSYISPIFTSCDSQYVDSNGVLSLTVFDTGVVSVVLFTGSPVMNPGGSATYTVVLATAPATDVVVTPTPVPTLSYSPSSVTFTSLDSGTPQTITVTASSTVSSLMGTTLLIGHTVTGDPEYAGNSLLVPSNVKAYVISTQKPAVLLSGDFVMKEGRDGSYWIALTMQPVGEVRVTITATGGVLKVTSDNPVVFKMLDYNTPRMVTVQVATGVAAMSYSGTLVHTVSSSDLVYNGSTPQPSATLQVTVVNICPLGYYSYPPGAGKCAPCPQGYSCSAVYQQPAACLSTQYSPYGEPRCLPCPGGYGCTGSGLPTRCATGTRSAPGAGLCTACPTGAPCGIRDGSDLAVCEAGTYLPTSSLLCRICPAGFGCSGTASAPQECAAGTLGWLGETYPCTKTCPAGYHCYDPQMSFRRVCPRGYYSAAGASACTPCPAGSACGTGAPVACGANTYSLAGWGVCKTCVWGNCSSKTAEVPCSDGQYSNAGVCTSCPAGNVCDRVISAKTPPGTAAPVGASSYTPCSLGNYAPFGATTCTQATLGNYSDNTRYALKKCPANRYAPTLGTYLCAYCPPTFICGVANSVPAACANGFYCHPYTPSQQTVDSKTPCPGGTTLTGTAHSNMDCGLCAAGKYCLEADSLGTTNCPMGFFCPTGTKHPYPCPGGTYNAALSLTSISLCTQCTAGKYCTSATVTPQDCWTGYYCPAGAWAPVECPAGKYLELATATAAADCITCVAGASCLAGSIAPLKCPPGRYRATTGAKNQSQDCALCPSASSCWQIGTVTPDACAPGFVCKDGTHFPDEFPCPAGTETQATNLINQSACTACLVGHYCILGTNQASNKRVRCPRGTLCSTAGANFSLSQICAAGTMNYGLGTTTGSCASCPAKAYCARGSFVISDQCAPGFYCPSGTARDDQNPCTAGTYSSSQKLIASAGCTNCLQGYYCYLGTAHPRMCPDGTYRATVSATKPSDCTACTGGYYCPKATVNQLPCGLGYYSLAQWSRCDICPAGTYCSTITTIDAPTNNQCPVNKWCPAGTTQDATLLPAFDCPVGYYCPQATSAPKPCPPGTKRTTNTTGTGLVGDCKSSTAGYYTVLHADSDTGRCEPGFYCPAGSTGPYQVPCPMNTFMLKPGGASVADCLACPAGYYCPLGTTTPVVCPLGFYCVANSQQPTMCPIGTLGQSPGLQAATSCSPCPVGYYCSQPGLIVPDGTCAPGVICAAGSTSSSGNSASPTVCSAGGYCEPGLGIKRDCPSGTYNPLTGAKDQSWCIPCTQKYYCVGSEVTPTLTCPVGYYCPTGTSFAKSYPASPGTYAPASSASASQCIPGTFSSQYAQASCTSCPSGFYCNLPNLSLPIACPAGGYCGAGVTGVTPCAAGTFNMIMYRTAATDCKQCTGGKYCGVAGLSLYQGDCDAGYWCKVGAALKNPSAVTATYGPCPVGFYCVAGTAEAVPCPSGTMRTLTMAPALSSCTNCLAGFYCTSTGRSSTEGSCSTGFYCPAGERTSTPSDRSAIDLRHCLAGQFCPTRSSIATNCAPGYYQLNEYQATCNVCPKGFYCAGATGNFFTSRCLAGYYCIVGTMTSTAYACAAGMYNSLQGRYSPSDCLSCDPGKYCAGTGNAVPDGDCDPGYFCKTQATLKNPPVPDPGDNNGGKCMAGTYCPAGSSAPKQCDGGNYCVSNALGAMSGLCAAGYYCISGSSTDQPKDGLHGNPCPLGNYCPSGSVSGIPCPKGTYFGGAGGTDISVCQACPQGSVCKGVGLLTITGQCPSGYYCPTGTFEDYPAAGRCQPGYMCPSGSFAPTPCLPGTYQDLPLQSTCKPCPGGYFCDITGLAVICPAGYYCPAGSMAAVPCPAGTYNQLVEMEIQSACTPCPPGKWCASGQSAPSGSCQVGYYCKGGTTTATPVRDVEGNRCKPGYFCPAGSPQPLLCSPGHYCNTNGLGAEAGLCNAGYYCLEAATTPTPMDGTTGDACPAGYYCPVGSVYAIPCPVGTYNSSPGKTAFTDCVTCPAGFYCADLAATATSGKCKAGYYCPAGEHSPSEVAFICPAGSYCPSGASSPLLCPAGTFNEFIGQSVCVQCPKGFTCEGSSNLPQACAAGHSCSGGTSLATRSTCGSSTYQPYAGQTLCLQCPAGFYCPVGPLTTPVVCPAGSYCPQGTDAPLPCPPGTYSSFISLQASEQCKFCPTGKYCLNGVIVSDCSSGFYCQSGCNIPTPDGYSNSGTGYPCPVGYYCPTGTDLPVPCPNGQFRMTTGGKAATDCTLCQAGYYCILNDPVPKPCPMGGYCPAGSSQPQLCPAGTYNSQYLGVSIDTCLPCPSGTLCSNSGIGLSSNYPCIQGYYCLAGALSPIVSLKGYFSPGAHAGSFRELLTCPGGFKCGEGSIGYIPCKEWNYCPPNSYYETPCPLGYFCGNTTAVPEICPAGWYCPPISSLLLEFPPIKCPTGGVCVSPSFQPVFCPIGQISVKAYGLSSQVPHCYTCGPGSYSNMTLSVCMDCTPGYVCLGNTTVSAPIDPDTEHGFMAQPGYYAIPGAFEEDACPIGTYNILSGQSSSDACTVCPEDTYNDAEGMSICYVCGFWANSNAERSTCVCSGKNRVFLASDKSCPCKANYEYVDKSGVGHSESGMQDCEPVVFTRCPSGQMRNEMGDCSDEYSCINECSGGIGKRTPGLGICECEKVVDVDTVCNSDCRKTVPRATVDPFGGMTIVDPLNATATLSINLNDEPGFMGKTLCYENQSCAVRFVDSRQSMSIGLYAPPMSVLRNATDIGRRLAWSNNGTSGIPNPVLCINLGETVVFSISAPEHYPVFQRHSLLNTNPDFDFSEFALLETRMKAGWKNITNFAYTFWQSGLMLFSDAVDTSQQTIISVMSANTKCPDNDKYIQPRTAASLKLLGAKLDETIILGVNWTMIYTLILSLFLSILIFTLLFYYYSKIAWKLPKRKSIPYRENNKKFYIEGDPTVKCKLRMYLEDDSDKSTEEEELTRMLFSRMPNTSERDDPTFVTENHDLDTDILPTILSRIKEANKSLLEHFEEVSKEAGGYVVEVRKKVEDIRRVLVEKAMPFIRNQDRGVLDVEETSRELDTPQVSLPRDLISSYRLVSMVEMDEETEELNRAAFRNLTSAPEVLEADKQKLMDEISGEYLKLQEQINYSKDRFSDYIKGKITNRAQRRQDIVSQKSKLESEVRDQRQQLDALSRKQQMLQAQEEVRIDQEVHFQQLQQRAHLAGPEIEKEYERLVEKCGEIPQETASFLRCFEMDMQKAEKSLSINQLREKSAIHKTMEELRIARQREAASERKQREEAERFFIQETLTTVEKSLEEIQMEEMLGNLIPMIEVQEVEVEDDWDAGATLADISIDVMSDTSTVTNKRRDALHESTQSQLEASCAKIREQLPTADGPTLQSLQQELARFQAKIEENEEHYNRLKKADLENMLEEKRRMRLESLRVKREKIEKDEKANESNRKAEIERRHAEVFENALKTLVENVPVHLYSAAVRAFLEEKHEVEFAKLREKQNREQRATHNALIEDSFRRKISDLNVIRKEFRARRLKVDKTDPNYDLKTQAILRAEKEVATHLDYTYAHDLEESLDKVWKDLRRKQAIEMTGLIDRQIEEARKAGVKQTEKGEMEEVEKMLTARKERLEQELGKKTRLIEQRKAELSLKSMQQQQDLEIIIQLEREAEQRKDAQRLEAIKQREIAEKRKLFEADLRARNISEDNMEVMLQDYIQHISHADRMLEQEKVKQSSILSHKLAEKRRKQLEIKDSLDRIREEQDRWKRKVEVLPSLKRKEANKLLNRWRRYPKKPIKEVVARLSGSTSAWTPAEVTVLQGEVTDGDSRLSEVMQRLERVEAIVKNVTKSQFSLLQKNLKVFANQLKD